MHSWGEEQFGHEVQNVDFFLFDGILYLNASDLTFQSVSLVCWASSVPSLRASPVSAADSGEVHAEEAVFQ